MCIKNKNRETKILILISMWVDGFLYALFFSVVGVVIVVVVDVVVVVVVLKMMPDFVSSVLVLSLCLYL